jgi:kynurenine formamidase
VAAGPVSLAGAKEGGGGPLIKKPVVRLVDLTHTLTPDFPTFFGGSQFTSTPLFELATDGFNMNEWELVEHTGTHMDAPYHFSNQDTPAEIPLERLVLPLAVVDIRAKAAANPDAQVTPADLRAWEARHGRIPRGSCVAMNSGWADRVNGPGFRNAGADGVLHFPGFHLEAADFLIEEREVYGIAVDTLSLDYGPSPDFAVHYRWLPTNRWGLEGVANLDHVPPAGSTIIAAVSKVQGATGGPTRVMALVHPGHS